MQPPLRSALATLIIIVAGCGGGPSAETVQRMEAAIAALRPGMDRLAALHAAVPAPADARELPLTAPIPKEGLEVLDFAHLEQILGKPERPDARPQPYLIGAAFQGQHVRYLEPDPDPSFAAALNLENRVASLAKVKHVAVFRATTLDKGEIGGKDAKGNYTIERPARWSGWVFVYAFEDPPRLVTAFPVERQSRDAMTLVVSQGNRPGEHHLLEDAAFMLERETRKRLTEAR